MKLIRDPYTFGRQIRTPFIQQRQHLSLAVGADNRRVSPPGRDRRRSGSVEPVRLTAMTTRQRPYPRRRRRRNIDDRLTTPDQPLGEILAETMRILDRPTTIRTEPVSPTQQAPITSLVCLNRDLAGYLMTAGQDRRSRMRPLMRVDAYRYHRLHLH